MSIKVTDLKVFDPADFINTAEDVVLFLKETLEENDPVALAEALRVIIRSEGMSKLSESNCDATEDLKRKGWSEASKVISAAGDDKLIWPEFSNSEDEKLQW